MIKVMFDAFCFFLYLGCETIYLHNVGRGHVGPVAVPVGGNHVFSSQSQFHCGIPLH